MMVRENFLAAVNKFEWFTAFLNGGATPEQAKQAIVAILTPYVEDKDLLRRLAVPVFANEAVNVARLLSRPEWAGLLDTAFDIRARAVAADKQRAFEVFRAFEIRIRESQRSYGLQVVFERPKEDLSLEEFAFEMFRLIGALIESTIQPFMKELYCLACVARNSPEGPEEILQADLGKVVASLDELIPDKNFLAPAPWNVRLNQWRNIAQHHSYKVEDDKILAHYGKSKSQRRIEVTRDELFLVAKELIRRLGALKSSRELTIANHLEELGETLPRAPVDAYAIATELGATFATQGFSLVDLRDHDGRIDARFIDVSPQIGSHRHLHCSQFILHIARRLPGRSVRISYEIGDGSNKWIFSIQNEKLLPLLEAENPWQEFADGMEISRVG